MTLQESCAKFKMMVFGVYFTARPVNDDHFQLMWHARDKQGVLRPQTSEEYYYEYPGSLEEALGSVFYDELESNLK